MDYRFIPKVSIGIVAVEDVTNCMIQLNEKFNISGERYTLVGENIILRKILLTLFRRPF
jgi:hypothetical protein